MMIDIPPDFIVQTEMQDLGSDFIFLADRSSSMRRKMDGLKSAMQFFLKGRASFLATRYLIATFQGGLIPDTILYLSYFYTGPRLPIRLAWYWMSSQLVEIGVGFAAVGLLSMRGSARTSSVFPVELGASPSHQSDPSIQKYGDARTSD